MHFLNAAVCIGALGYFVDVFDLFLFSVVRVQSLRALGVQPEEMLRTGVWLINSQMAGLILGGMFWGVTADKRGRRTVLFASILAYSIANLLNAAVTSVEAYALLRFVAGFGLAGELGAAIALVSESLPASQRGMGTTLVATFGLLGGVAAALTGELLPWRQAYFLGGVLGLVLLGLRFKLEESPVFSGSRNQSASRGDLRLLLGSPRLAQKYLACILAGVPVYFVAGILILFSPEFARELGIQGEVLSSRAVLYSYIGAAVGDLISGVASQLLKSRKRVILVCLGLNLFLILLYLASQGRSVEEFYWLCGVMGLTTGYWAVLLTLSAEQFGTNLRATVATSVPNWVRGAVIPLTMVFMMLKGSVGLLHAAMGVACVVTLLAALALLRLDETYGREIDYVEA